MAAARKVTVRAAWIAAVVLCHGCGGGGGGGGSPPPPSSYAVGGAVSGLRGTGLVLQNNAADPLQVASNGGFTFASGVTSGGVYNVTVRTQPTATPAQTCTVANGTGTASAAVASIAVSCRAQSGRYLYVPNDHTVAAFAIDVTTGNLTPIAGSPFAVAGPALGYIAVDPTGKFLLVTGGLDLNGSGALSVLAIDSATGALTVAPGMPVLLPRFPSWPSFTGGHFVYLGVSALSSNPDNGIYGFSIDASTGALTPVPGSPVHHANNVFARSGIFDPHGGAHFYTPVGSTVALFGANPITGELVALSSAPAPNVVNDIAINANGAALYSRNVNATTTLYAVDAVTGALTPSTSVPSGIGLGLIFAANGKFAYVGGQDTVLAAGGVSQPVQGGVFAFSVDQTTGVLTALPGSPFSPGGMNVFGMMTDPTGGYLAMTSRQSATVTVFAIDSATGVLSHIPGSPYTPSVGTTPGPVVFDPSGRFAYLVDSGTNSVSTYRIDLVTGAPVFVGSVSAGNAPNGVAVIAGRQ